jgi:hypothetical protein
MSDRTQQSAECPQCQSVVDVTVHHSVNVGLEPAFKRRVLDQELNRFVCPKCGLKGALSAPLLYQDPKKELLIQLAKGDFDTKALASVPTKGFITRLVHDENELVEKILLFDADLNDYTFEWMKLMLKYQQSHTAEYELFFHALKRETIVLSAIKGSEMFSTEIPRSGYEQAEEALEELGFAPNQALKWPCVDQAYVVELAERLAAGRAKR